MRRRLATASLLSLLILTVGATSVFAHECFNASRSAQGNTGAQHSGNWFNLTTEFVFTVILPGDGPPFHLQPASLRVAAQLFAAGDDRRVQ